MAGREAVEGKRAEENREAATRGSEDGNTRLPGDHAGKRDKQRGLVRDDDGRVEPGGLRDERQKPVPEREGVAGVEPTSGELVDRPQVQVVEVDELAHPAFVEEPVAGDRARDVPEGEAEQRPRARTRSRARTRAGSSRWRFAAVRSRL